MFSSTIAVFPDRSHHHPEVYYRVFFGKISLLCPGEKLSYSFAVTNKRVQEGLRKSAVCLATSTASNTWHTTTASGARHKWRVAALAAHIRGATRSALVKGAHNHRFPFIKTFYNFKASQVR